MRAPYSSEGLPRTYAELLEARSAEQRRRERRERAIARGLIPNPKTTPGALAAPPSPRRPM